MESKTSPPEQPKPSSAEREDDNVQRVATPPSANAGGLSCTRCFKSVTPMTDTYPTTKTHVLAVILFFLGLPFLVCLPYMFDLFGTKIRRCPNCGCIIPNP
ncbi:uncharacterized protein LOC118434289 [Folsomia candida]|uniref:uncharacterized protein LOC118434289 n=1 Tax=Folsomia candida TaxID=158441 RepID=UPI0016054884|nr:uncharacterized protein LOC118434289 [Folsomia candida]